MTLSDSEDEREFRVFGVFVGFKIVRRFEGNTYREVVAAAQAAGKVTVAATFACEIGGRWCPSALAQVKKLVRARRQQTKPLLRLAARQAWQRRWWSMLSVGLQDALACNLLDMPDAASGNAGPSPSLSEILDHPFAGPPEASRLPLR